MGQLLDLIIHQGDIRGVHGNVTAHTAHGYADIGLFQSRCIIDAVADHAHRLPLLLQRSDVLQLILRQTVCADLLYAETAANDVGRILVVAGQQHRLDLHPMQYLDHGRTFLPDCIRQNEVACQMIPDGNIDDGTAFQKVFPGIDSQGAGNGDLLQQLPVTGFYGFAVDDSGNALAGDHGKLFCRGQGLPYFLPVAGHDGFPQRMLRKLLHCRRIRIKLLFSKIRNGLDRNDLRRAIGQGTRLVKGDFCNGCKPLQRISFPYQKTMLRRIADGRHNGRRRRQHQGAGAEYNQNGDRPNDLARNEPGQSCRSQRNDHNPGGPSVRQAHDLRLVRVSRLYQPNHSLNGAVLTDLGGLHLEYAKLIDRAGGNGITDGFIHRQGFSGHDRLIDGGLSGTNHTVYRNGFARQDADSVTDSNLLRRNNLLPVSIHDPCGPGRQMNQFFDTCSGSGHGQFFQQGAQLHDKCHLARRKILTDAYRCDQGQGDQHIRFDVKGGHQADDGFQDDGKSTQDNGDPGCVKGQRHQIKQTDDQ